MKNLNKVLAMLVVFMMMLSTVAFASSFSDVADTSSYSTAIEVGVDLGLFKGYEDGTFKPEGEITRAEFAAIIVRLLGQEAQAEGAKAATQFIDVPADHWAAGYVNIAVQAGVINGYGNGNFGPEDLVEYQDAITMMVRALGYEPAIGSAGYPTGYLTKAGELGLTTGVNGTNGVAINRGTVAQIAFNALDVPLMTQSGYGTFTQYVINDGYSATTGQANVKKTLLSENHSTVKLMGIIESSSDDTSATVTGVDTVTVDVKNVMYNKFGIANKKINGRDTDGDGAIDTWTEVPVKMEVGSSDAISYVGKKCVIFVEYDEFNAKRTVKALYEAPADDSIVVDFADIEELVNVMANTTYNVDTDNNNVADDYIGELKTEDYKVTIAKNADVYYNGVKLSSVKSIAPTDAQLIKKSGTIELALLDNTSTSADYDTVYITAYDVVVVDEVRESASRVVAKTYSDGQLSRISYDESNGDVKASLYDAEGKAMDWADLEENTVLAVKYVKTEKAIIEAQIINNVVTGTVTEVDKSAAWGTNSQTDNDYKYVWIDGTEYKVLACAELNNADIEVGTEGTFYLGSSGIVWHEATVALNTNYAYVISAQNESGLDGARIKMVTADGIATYDVASKIYVTYLGANRAGYYEKSTSKLAVKGANDNVASAIVTNSIVDLEFVVEKLITFKTDANGVITAIELPLTAGTPDPNTNPSEPYDAEKYFTIHQDGGNLTGYDPDDMSFTGGLTLTENTVVFDRTATDPADWEVVALKNLAEDDELHNVKVYNVDDDDYVGAIVVSGSTSKISGSTNAATFVVGSSKANNEDGEEVTYVKGFLNGEEVVYEFDGTAPANGSLVIPKYNANGKVKEFHVVGANSVLSTVIDRDYDNDNDQTDDKMKGYYYAMTSNADANLTQNSKKGRIFITFAQNDTETLKVPTDANVYVYDSRNASAGKRVKYTTDAYVGYVEYDNAVQNSWGWYLDEDNKNLKVVVHAYEYDGDIVDVVYEIID